MCVSLFISCSFRFFLRHRDLRRLIQSCFMLFMLLCYFLLSVSIFRSMCFLSLFFLSPAASDILSSIYICVVVIQWSCFMLFLILFVSLLSVSIFGFLYVFLSLISRSLLYFLLLYHHRLHLVWFCVILALILLSCISFYFRSFFF